MGEILSQEEIDALLAALETQELSAKEQVVQKEVRRVKEYDFRRPDKFSKDQVRSLHMIMENFGRSWSTYLSGKLRSLVYLEIVAIDQLPYEEFIRSTFSPSVISIISMEPLEGNAIMDIAPLLAFSIIERLVGGSGGDYEKIRELTEIEEALMENVIADSLRIFKNSISEVIQINPRLEAIEYNPQFTQIVPPSDMTLFISFEMRIETIKGMIGFCFPHMLLEPILTDLSTERFFRRTKEETHEGAARTEVVIDHLRATSLELRIEVGSAELNVGEVLNLSPGDVISLGSRVGDPMRVYIGDDPNPRFLARPGLIGRNRGIEILDFYEE